MDPVTMAINALLQSAPAEYDLAAHLSELGVRVTPDKWLDKKEAANFLGVTTRTVDLMRARGELPWFKVGKTGGNRRLVKFRLSDIEKQLVME